MSEKGWKDFLHAEGVEDWVVLHGGAVAVFRVATIVEAAGLAGAILDSEAPRWWTLSDRAGNRVCIAAWPDGAAGE